jgi:hypothetical protein
MVLDVKAFNPGGEDDRGESVMMIATYCRRLTVEESSDRLDSLELRCFASSLLF